MSPITTHILDTSLGKPARDVPVTLAFQQDENVWQDLGHGTTNEDGRVGNFLAPSSPLEVGIYRIRFDTGHYYRTLGTTGFYPSVEIVFEIHDPAQHYHVPLLLNPYGYSTYRGS